MLLYPYSQGRSYLGLAIKHYKKTELPPDDSTATSKWFQCPKIETKNVLIRYPLHNTSSQLLPCSKTEKSTRMLTAT